MAGYVFGCIPVMLSLVGMLFLPRHSSFMNQTIRSTDTCPGNVTSAQGKPVVNDPLFHLAKDLTEDTGYEPWHVIFWATPLLTGPFVSICFTIPCLLVSHFTESTVVDDNLLIEIFQSPIYPSWLRSFFKIKSNQEEIDIPNGRDDKILT